MPGWPSIPYVDGTPGHQLIAMNQHPFWRRGSNVSPSCAHISLVCAGAAIARVSWSPGIELGMFWHQGQPYCP